MFTVRSLIACVGFSQLGMLVEVVILKYFVLGQSFMVNALALFVLCW